MRRNRVHTTFHRANPKSHQKVSKAIKHYQKLQIRIKDEGETPWLKDAMERVNVKLKKYGVTP